MQEKSVSGRISTFALVLAAYPQKCKDSITEDLIQRPGLLASDVAM